MPKAIHDGFAVNSLPSKLQFIVLFNNEPRMVRVKIASNFYSHSGTGKNDSELSNRTVIGNFPDYRGSLKAYKVTSRVRFGKSKKAKILRKIS